MFTKTSAMTLSACLAVLVSASAPAQETAPVTVGSLDAIQQEYFKTQLLGKLAEAKATLAKNTEASTADQGFDDNGGAPTCGDTYKGPRGYRQVFLYSDGTSITAKDGDVIPGNWSVRIVDLNTVRITREGRTRACGVSSGAVASQPTPQQVPSGPVFFNAPGTIPSPAPAAQ